MRSNGRKWRTRGSSIFRAFTRRDWHSIMGCCAIRDSGLSAAMKTAGDLAVSEKISDPDWKRADLRRGRTAMLTFGLGTMVSSVAGGFAVMSSSSNIGLAAATGAASRYIGYACGAILIALRFSRSW